MAARLPGMRSAALVLLALLVIVPTLRVALGARLEPADFTYNNGTEIGSLDPAAITGIPDGRVMRAIYEGLYVRHPRTLEPLPGMATHHDLSDDGLVYTFHLREVAVWSNGDPVTAHDFAWSWERLLHPDTAAEYVYQAWYIDGAKEYTLLPEDLLIVRGTPDPRNPYASETWLRALGDRRYRVGSTAFRSEEERTSEARGRPVSGFWQALNGAQVRAATEGHVNAAPDPADPYGDGWTMEVRLEDEVVEAALESGELVDTATYRREHAWPEHVGVRALDDHTLEVRLASPTPYFVQLVSFYPLYPVHRGSIEAAQERWPDSWRLEWLKPEHLVTNGPFRVAERRINDRIRLTKNPLYWDADAVAFDTIDVLAVENYSTMLNMYLSGEVDWIDRASTNQVQRLLGREDFVPVPYLGSYFYRFNVTEPPFDDLRVRRALALTVDRRAICEKITKSGQAPTWALVPPGMVGYPAAQEMRHTPVADDFSDYDEAFAADVEEAKALLAEAGFRVPGREGGEPFPTFEIHYNTSEAHRDIAEFIASEWRKHLGLDTQLLNQEFKVYLDTQRNLDYQVSRSAWIGDYVDPNTFLDLFQTGNENNKTGWSNARYDQLIAGSALAQDPAERMRMLAEAEAIVLEELPILPIYFYVTQSLFDPRVGGFYNNLLDEHFPKFWYWKSDEELAADRAELAPHLRQVEVGGPPEGKYAPAHVPGRWE